MSEQLPNFEIKLYDNREFDLKSKSSGNRFNLAIIT
jgi:hypothetical protein